MRKVMNNKKVIAIIAVVVLAAALFASGVIASPPRGGGPPVELEMINYQGQLTDNVGNPLDGVYDMEFTLYDAASGGSQVGSTITKNNIQVNNGLFSVKLDVNQWHFNGQGLWLEVKVEGETLSPRQEILPVPYALSLKPGASIIGEAYPALHAESTHPSGRGLRGYATSETGTNYGVVGASRSPDGFGGFFYNNSASGNGVGVKGWTESPEGYGGYFESRATSGEAYGVYAESDSPDGYGVYGKNESSGNYGYIGDEENGVYGYSGTVGGHGVYGSSDAWNGAGVYGYGTSSGVRGFSSSGSGVYGWSDGVGVRATSGDGVGLRAISNTGNPIEAYGAGYGTGDMEFYVSNSGEVYADGNFHSGGADFAEMLAANEGLEPGDVLVIGPDGKLARSSEPYASNVVGVYSTNPGFVGGDSDDKDMAGKVPLAIVGVVPVKASAENGSIAPGDLLTSASKPGYAMKATDLKVGTILGKALELLDEGTGVILMLVMLQ